MLLGTSTTLNIIHIRAKQKSFKGKDRSDAIKRVKNMLGAVKFDKDLTQCVHSSYLELLVCSLMC